MLTAESVCERLHVNPQKGLSTAEHEQRLKEVFSLFVCILCSNAASTQNGPNTLPVPSVSFISVFFEEVTEPLILLLIVVAVLFGVWDSPSETGVAIAIIAITIGLEIWTEYKAKNAVAKLKYTPLFALPISLCLHLPVFSRFPLFQRVCLPS